MRTSPFSGDRFMFNRFNMDARNNVLLTEELEHLRSECFRGPRLARRLASRARVQWLIPRKGAARSGSSARASKPRNIRALVQKRLRAPKTASDFLMISPGRVQYRRYTCPRRCVSTSQGARWNQIDAMR